MYPNANIVTSNTDFTGCGPYLTIALVVMLLFGIVTIFFRFPMLQVVYSALIVLLYGFYLIYDTQLISGRFGTFYSLDDYFLASLSLFLDIMQLFLNILNIAGR
jgi:FtsH-binding integral membrane protein